MNYTQYNDPRTKYTIKYSFKSQNDNHTYCNV